MPQKYKPRNDVERAKKRVRDAKYRRQHAKRIYERMQLWKAQQREFGWIVGDALASLIGKRA